MSHGYVGWQRTHVWFCDDCHHAELMRGSRTCASEARDACEARRAVCLLRTPPSPDALTWPPRRDVRDLLDPYAKPSFRARKRA